MVRRFGFWDGLRVGAKGLVVGLVSGVFAAVIYMLAKYVAEQFVALGWLIAVAGLVFYIWLWGLVANKFWNWN